MPDSSPTANPLLAVADPHGVVGDAPARPPLSTPRLLCVRGSEPSWVSLALGFHSAAIDIPRLVWVATSREALGRVRDEQFDCVLVDYPPAGVSPSDDNGPFGLVRALRTAGHEEPVVIVALLFTDPDWTEACLLDCDVFVSPRGWNSASLGRLVLRSVRRGAQAREHRQLTIADHRRLVREREESEQLLAQQRQIISELESLPDLLESRSPGSGERGNRSLNLDPAPILEPVPSEFTASYAGLLRSYVLMGSGSLAGEIAETADRLLAARVSPPEALQLHVHCVEQLMRGLGNRSARHVVARADLLAVEMMTHLASRTQQAAALSGIVQPKSTSAHTFRNVTGISGIDLSVEPPVV
jgi:hypothetical protein